WYVIIINLSNNEFNNDCSSYTINADFKVYSSYYESVKDHTALLSTKRYKTVRKASDYVDACYAVYNCGYATYPNYPENLIEVIENFNLEEYDIIAKKNAENDYTLTKVESENYDDSLSSVSGNNCADLFKDTSDSGKDTKNVKNNIVLISVK
ncbi:MAG: glucosaminidase domain-containing protein, partial [Clostridium sp.]